MLITNSRFAFPGAIALLVVGCVPDPPPRSVDEFVENPMLLEATMVRCAENRSQMKYDADCVSARDAANRLAAIQDQAQRAELDAQSEQKRQALRRTQEAAAEARQRAAEAQRLREEAAYLGQFEAAPPSRTAADPAAAAADNSPGVTVSPMPQTVPDEPGTAPPSDLEAIREELKRRQDESQ